jgi:hypothetical protein
MAYFQAVQAWLRRHAPKSASVRFARKTGHALRKWSRLVEDRRSAAEMLPWPGAGVEAAAPAPSVRVDRHTGPAADVTDTDIAEEDVPALAVRVIVAAAGELGHAPLKRGLSRQANGPMGCANRSAAISQSAKKDTGKRWL